MALQSTLQVYLPTVEAQTSNRAACARIALVAALDVAMSASSPNSSGARSDASRHAIVVQLAYNSALRLCGRSRVGLCIKASPGSFICNLMGRRSTRLLTTLWRAFAQAHGGTFHWDSR